MKPTQLTASVFMAFVAFSSARAVPAPNVALPACTIVDGQQAGACPDIETNLFLSSTGRIVEGGEITINREPQVGVCDSWDIPGATWSPSPCYSEWRDVRVAGCGYIDMVSGDFRTTGCSTALGVMGVDDLFSFASDLSAGSCKGDSDFSTYFFGGPGNDPEAIWAARGPKGEDCRVSYSGPRPLELFGPTWVRFRTGIEIQESGSGISSFPVSSEVYVPIDGELRDLGPVAAFRIADVDGANVSFENASVHTTGQSMSYQWNFGDGGTSSATDPTHTYDAPGRYDVTLTVTDPDGDEDDSTVPFDLVFELSVELQVTSDPSANDLVDLKMTVRNPFDEAVEAFRLKGAFGLDMAPSRWVLESGPSPPPPASLGPGQSAVFSYQIDPLKAGRFGVTGGAEGWLNGIRVAGRGVVNVQLPPNMSVVLTTSANSRTKVGDTFDVIATVTNEEEEGTISDIKTESLTVLPELLSVAGGPFTDTGADPRVSPATLGPGESTTFTWSYTADEKGVAELTAFVSGRDPNSGAVFFVSDSARLAIEVAALEITELRFQPGSPVPGDYGTIRGKLVNIGTVDLTDIDFILDGEPVVNVVERLLNELDPSIHPRPPLLAVEEERDFLIPSHMVTDAGDLATYRIGVTMLGQAMIDGQQTEVEHRLETKGGLDLTDYWTTILGDVRALLFSGLVSFIDRIEEIGESSTLGGIGVGSAQGVLSAFQKMGDGLLSANDFIGETVGDGGQTLTKQGEAVVGAIREYVNTTSPKKMLIDFADVRDDLSVAGVGLVADWMWDVDNAYKAGDTQKVAALLTEPATTLASGIGAEAAGAQLFAKLMRSAPARKVMAGLKKAPEPLDANGPDFDPGDAYAKDGGDLKDMPTGVRISGQTVARAGITVDEHAWMIEVAKANPGVTFFVRPRPADAAKFARMGFNAKPVSIKLKSVNDIDAEWLGYDDYRDKQGLVVFREPKDPYPKLKAKMEAGELDPDSAEGDKIFKDVLTRYEKRLAEWETRGELLLKLNEGDGFEIRRYGKTIKTKVRLDADGLVRFTHNNQPVFSDIDLMQIAYSDGSPIPADLHRAISKDAGFGFDWQHGDSASTSDFPNWKVAKKFAKEYTDEHKRGGEPLVIIQADVTTLGYVTSADIPDSVDGAGYDLYAKVKMVYEGGGFP